MKHRYPSLTKVFFVVIALPAFPLLTLLDFLVLEPETTLVLAEKVYSREMRSRGRHVTQHFIETDKLGRLQIFNAHPWRSGQYLLITQSRVFGVRTHLGGLNEHREGRAQGEWKILVGMALFALLSSTVFVLSRFSPWQSIICAVSHFLLLSFLWLYAAAG